MGATFSPIKGSQGNIEYLYYIKKGECENPVSFEEIEEMVKASHNELD